MQKWEALLFGFGFVEYGMALGCLLIYAFTRRESFSRWGYRFLLVAVALHAGSLGAGLWAEAHRPGHVGYAFWGHWFMSLSLFAFFIAAVSLGVQWKACLHILGVFTLPLAVFLLSLALGQAFLASPRCPFASVEDFLKIVDVTRRQPGIPPTLWTSLHVPLIFLAYAAFANAFGVGLAFLIEERQMKNHHVRDWTYRLPPLEDMDRLIARIVLGAFSALTVGLALGAGGARAAGGPGWASDPKVFWSLLAWGVYLSYLVLRYVVGWRGRRSIYVSLVGFALLVFTYAGVSFFSQLHTFLQSGLPG